MTLSNRPREHALADNRPRPAAANVSVLESFRDPRNTTNPYIVQLARALEQEPGCDMATFSFRQALFSSYDVFHVHWPEIIYTGHSRLKGAAREFLFALVLMRVQLRGTAVVRTRHNIQPHSRLSRRQQLLESWLDRLTTVSIRLNETTGSLPGAATATILHGHYVDWFAPYPANRQVRGRVAYFGLIRGYKGVDRLLAAFQASKTPGLTLSISGKPTHPENGIRLRENARGDSRVQLHLGYLTDQELVTAVTQAEMVVLPYTSMHNSGAALAALSLMRPILVPDTGVNRSLAKEVGRGWVHFFTGDLAAGAVDAAVADLRANPPGSPPDLSARSWDTVGRDHLHAFECAMHRKSVARGSGPHALGQDVG